MNPKAMPRQQLLGHIDMDTREWADGVLTHSARIVVREPQGKTRMLILRSKEFTDNLFSYHLFEKHHLVLYFL